MAREYIRSRWHWLGTIMAAWAATGVSLSYGQDVAFGTNRWKSCPPAQTQECPKPDLVAPPAEKSEAVAPQVPLAPTIPTERFAALPSESVALADSSAVGYIDPALPRTQFRLRYNNASNDNRPDRAEYFYAKYNYFSTPAAQIISNVTPDPKAKGLPLGEPRVNFQDITAYFELAYDHQFSVFTELPQRFIRPEFNNNFEGFSDMSAGLKWAFVNTQDQVASFQLTTYIPTGDSTRGLGNNHVSLEPALLYFNALSNRLELDSEFKVWVPVGGTDFSGDILNYGVGLAYHFNPTGKIDVAPVAEFVGWTVLNGKESFVPNISTVTVLSAGGDTIINAKVGARVAFGPHNDFYIGYGRALTGDVWYKDILRLEYRWKY